jgi:GH24 family phage-related lysozyme (muramidase)
MKVSLTEEQFNRIKSKMIYETVLDDIVFKLSLITEDGKTEPDMEWDFTNVKKDIDLSKIWVKTQEDFEVYMEKLIDKIKNLPTNIKQKILKYTLYSFLGLISLKQINQYLNPPLQQAVKAEKEIIKNIEKPQPIRKSSERLFNHLKWEEGSVVNKGEPVLKAYDLGDGAYTIGYGHAIFKGENEGYDFLPDYNDIKPNRTEITKDQAETLLKDDIKESERIINDMLNDWEKEGIKPNLTQGMYDALVSLAYNMGPNVKNKKFIEAVKKGDFKEARRLILNTSSSLFDEFPGLKTRREKEAKMFA